MCCQTAEITAKDCIYDVARWCFRPVTGEDTSDVASCPDSMLEADLAGAGYDTVLARCSTSWSASAHDTHQDPGVSSGGSACNTLLGDGIDFWSCVGQLTVASERGLCLAKSPTVQVCPTDLPDYVDACEKLNQDLGYTCG